MYNINNLLKNSLIISLEEIILKEEMLKGLNKQAKKIARETAGLIYAYKIIYKSQGHKVVGYIVEPRKGDNLPCIICNRGGSRDFSKIESRDLFTKILGRFPG